tara:strand:- start:2961 stop:3662 length:702 start_codon:yes stop_codon:yes gene_type:complete
MIEEKDFETYLYVEKNKFIIFLFDTNKSTNIYKEEILFKNYYDISFKKLSEFLDNNIFKIEKLLGKFIKNIFLIVEDEIELETIICVKKKNDNNKTNQKNLYQALLDVKDLFKENNQNQKIIHMLINNFSIHRKVYEEFIENLESEYSYLDIKFLTLSDKSISKFEKILEKYQIQIKQFISGKYLKKIIGDKKFEISEMAHKIRKGYNPNEIKIVPKTYTNKGFFEKFFHLFS